MAQGEQACRPGEPKGQTQAPPTQAGGESVSEPHPQDRRPPSTREGGHLVAASWVPCWPASVDVPASPRQMMGTIGQLQTPLRHIGVGAMFEPTHPP